MDDFYMQQTRKLEEVVAKMRSVLTEVAMMKEMAYELELSMSTLHNPETMVKLSNTESIFKETGSLSNSLEENEQGFASTTEIKIECCDSDNHQATHESENVLADREISLELVTLVKGASSQLG